MPEATIETDVRLVPVRAAADVLPEYRETPIATLLGVHCLGAPAPPSAEPELVIVTCMDHRVELRMPKGFAFIVRTAGANVEPVEFNLACAMALRPVRTVAVIGHSDCAMVDMGRHRAAYLDVIPGLGSRSTEDVARQFDEGAACFGCDDAVTHTLRQCAVLRAAAPGVLIAPLYYVVADGTLTQIVA